MTAVAAPARARRSSPERLLVYGCAILITLFMLTPVYLITLAAFSSRAAIFDYPRALLATPRPLFAEPGRSDDMYQMQASIPVTVLISRGRPARILLFLFHGEFRVL